MNFSPMDFAQAILIICVGLAILVPVVGITARIALKPIVDAFARIREGNSSSESMLLLERRMDLLEREVQSVTALHEDVSRLRDEQAFQLRLAGGSEESRSLEERSS